MQPCASAAKLRSGGPILFLGITAMAQTGTRHLEPSSATRHKRTDWAETVGCLQRPPFIAGRGPGQVLLAAGTALLSAGPGAIFGSFGADAKKAFSSDALLALIYSYPLFAVAIVTVFLKVRTAQDYIGGVALMALALFALWASSDLQGTRGFSFGAGTAPRMFGVLMLALGAAIALTGLFIEGPGLSHYAWRGPLFVSAAILFFALAIRPLGVIVTAFASFMIAALGTHETRWIEAVIVGACLTAGCADRFPYIP